MQAASKEIECVDGENSFGPYCDRIYDIGVSHGQRVLVRESEAWFQNYWGKKTTRWSVKLADSPVWIGTFNTFEAAAMFYADNPCLSCSCPEPCCNVVCDYQS